MRGILINNEIHTGNDLRLVMTRKTIAPPNVQTFEATVPGRNGKLDLSEFLTGEPTYDNRKLEFEFVGDGSRETVLLLIDEMLSFHGQYITVTLDDYPFWYFTGRVTIDHSDNGNHVIFTVSVDAQPFRYAIKPREYTVAGVTDEALILPNVGVSVIPTVTVTEETTLVMGDITVTLTAGTYELDNFKLRRGDNLITITSTGTVTLTYREAVI